MCAAADQGEEDTGQEGFPPPYTMATLVAMTIESAMALRDVKNRLSEVVDHVERERGRVTITRHGKSAAVVISADDLAALEETLDIMSRPQLMGEIRQSLTELAADGGTARTKDEILDLLHR